MNLQHRIIETWAQHFGLPVDLLQLPGTSLVPREHRSETSWLTMWRAGERVVIEVAPTWQKSIQQIVDAFPADHRMTAADFAAVWGAENLDYAYLYIYFLDAAQFTPVMPDARYTVRQLTPDDQPAMDAFQAACSTDDWEEGDVSIDHEMAAGVFDGERLVAVSSVFDWRGFADIGILTDPAYRGQGLAKAAVSFLCAYYLPRERVVVYRHDQDNTGSQRVAQGLNFTPYATVESVRQV